MNRYLHSRRELRRAGWAWSVAGADSTPFQGLGGWALSEPEARPVARETLWDLASLTKPLATALLALRASDAGLLDLEEPLGGLSPPASLLDLLRHDGGFPPWLPLYAFARNREGAFRWLLREAPRRAGGPPEYSCLGYILAGLLLEERLGAPLPELFRRFVSQPLGLGGEEALFAPPGALRERAAATELHGESEAEMARPYGAAPPPFRGGVAWGEVHDGNARFLGGAAGNAGLFATLRGVEVLASAFFPSRRFLSPRALAWAWESPHAAGGVRRTAGWKCGDSAPWAAAAHLPWGAVGHEGYTGTAVYLDRERERAYILLTNRIHPVHPGSDFGPVRAAFLERARTLP
ncbi:MAG: serine hydrolase domain-containing protein [Acidobacteriota bacterium]